MLDILDVVVSPSSSSSNTLEELEDMMMRVPYPSTNANSKPSSALSRKSTKSSSRPPLPAPTVIPESQILSMEDEPNFQKDIYSDEFLDFNPSTTTTMVMTPRIIRPPTTNVDRPSTAQSWVSSTPSSSSSVIEVPLDTYVDEQRLYSAFSTVRNALMLELDKHSETVKLIEKLKVQLVLEEEVNVMQHEQLKKEEKHTALISEDYNHLVKEHTLIMECSEDEIEDLYRQIRDVKSAGERAKRSGAGGVVTDGRVRSDERTHS